MNIPYLKHGDLLKEKNLWQIYKATWNIPDNRFNWLVGIISLLFFLCYVTISGDIKGMHELLLKLAEIGFNSAVTLLGFLIAGFTIFGSLAKPELLLTMLKHTHKKSGLSYLKYNFFTIIRTFIYFLIFAAFQLIIIAIGQRNGIIAELVKYYPFLQPVAGLAIRSCLVASAVLWVAVFLELKSFVYNVHHFVFTMVKFEAVNHNEKLDVVVKGKSDSDG